jgi:hypothetical protein
MKRWFVMLAVVVVVAVAAVAITMVAQAAGGRKLTGCMHLGSGELDQVRYGDSPRGGECDGANEIAVTWNVRGPRGLQGPQGLQGPTGATGTPGVSGWEIVTSTSAYSSISPRQQVVSCPAGKKVVGGGGSANPVAVLYASHPGPGGDSWTVMAVESPATSMNWYLDAFAICVTALP